MTKGNQGQPVVEDVEFAPSQPKFFPPAIERKVKVLRAQNDALNQLQEEYRKERLALEAKFIEKKQGYCDKRRAILLGEQDVAPAEGEEQAGEPLPLFSAFSLMICGPLKQFLQRILRVFQTFGLIASPQFLRSLP